MIPPEKIALTRVYKKALPASRGSTLKAKKGAKKPNASAPFND